VDQATCADTPNLLVPTGLPNAYVLNNPATSLDLNGVTCTIENADATLNSAFTAYSASST
jgi:hypothetical protein